MVAQNQEDEYSVAVSAIVGPAYIQQPQAIHFTRGEDTTAS
jgi:hypothetical protein